VREFGSQIVSALIVVKMLELLKNTQWYQHFSTAMPISNRRVHQFVSIAGAFVSALGIHIAVSGSWQNGWRFAGEIPAGPQLFTSFWDWAQQFVLNQGLFDMVYKQFPTATVTVGDRSITGPADRIFPPLPPKNGVRV
jgi:hypothetical protein